MRITSCCTIGINKNECEDTCLVNSSVINNTFFESDVDDLHIVAICDGVGGNNGGKDASLYISEHLKRINWEADTNKIKNSIVCLNDELIEYGNSNQDKNQMATTLTAIIQINKKYYIIHVGNTRLYALQGAYLKQLTSDQTTYQWLIQRGEYKAAESSNKSELLSCLGGGNKKYIQQVQIKEIYKDHLPNAIILTSDGIHDYIDIDRLEEILQCSTSDKEFIELLIDESTKNGSKDDKSIIVIR